LKAEEQYPKSQIRKIDELLAEQQRQADEAARLAAEKKALDDKYASIITLADSQFESGDYVSAKTSYTDALALKAEEQYPKSQIRKIDELLAEQQRQADEAARLTAERKALNEKYQTFIELADSQFKNQDYLNSRESYKEALNLKITEPYPKAQLQKISEILAEQKKKAEEEAKRLAQQQLNDNKYLNLLESANKYFELKQWESAINDYQTALKLKPEEQYPKNRIDEIELILSELERKANKKSELKREYDALIEIADKQFGDKEYDFAVLKYQEALELMPKESYPKSQVKKIEVILERLTIAERKEKELNQKYSEELEKAEEFFKQEQFSVARHHYKAALEIKPKEEYPKEKLDEIRERLRALKNAEQEAIANNPSNFEKKLSIIKEREYADLIEKADQAFQLSQFTVSKVMYERALRMFEREYPKKQLKEIDKLIREEKSSVLSEEYKQLIAKGDKELSANHYSVAKFYYGKAIQLNSKEKYPKNQIRKIEELLKSRKNQKLDKEYEEVIKKADDAFDKGSLTVARFYYKKANQLKENENYPKEKLKTIQSMQSKK
jgi:tetratricopeptide (TPR) repeat protein